MNVTVSLAPQVLSNLDAALALAAQGLSVFPVWWMADGVCACRANGFCRPGAKKHEECTADVCKACHPGKHPITPRGLWDASTDPKQVSAWWTLAPAANVGIAVPDAHAVVDVDPRHGGDATYSELESTKGFPMTRAAATGGGGAHFWFRIPAGRSLPSKLGKGVDVKQLGGYVLAPPSNHVSGGVYKWASAPEAPIAEAPAWLLALSQARGERKIVALEEDEREADDATLDGIAAAVAPYFAHGKMHDIAKNLSAWMKQRGYGLSDAKYVIERLPCKNTQNALGAAVAAFKIDRPFGWTELRGLMGEAPAAALDAVTPNPRRARELEERAAASAMIPDIAAGAVVLGPRLAPANESEATAPVGGPAPAAPKEKRKPLTTADVVNILAAGVWAEVLGYDALANRVMCTREPPMRPIDNPGSPCAGEWNDAHTARARTWICGQFGSEPTKDATDAAVEIVARRRTYHPVQNYLAGLGWDGVPRLDGLLARYFGAAPTEYARLVGAKTMIAAVARATRPGCKVDTMLIFEGDQGTGKSTAVRALAGEWFADTPLDLESKDAAQCLQGKWIYEIGELHSFNRTETTRIKAFVSSQSDNLRPSYGRRNQDFPRQCVFIGTTNGTEYLTDTTGNRRYWPVRCGRIDVTGLQRDRDQLWAEAASRFSAGERWWLEGTEVNVAEAQQADREATDPWEQPIVAWLDQPITSGGAPPALRGAFMMHDVLTGALHLSSGEHTQANATRVGKILARLGWRPKATKDPATKKVLRLYAKAAA